MKVTVIGAGAIGGVVGTLLKRGGTEVTLVDVDEAHIRAIQEKGMTIITCDEGDIHVPVPAYTVEEFLVRQKEPLECVLLAVKGQHTRSALEPIAPLVGKDGFVVSLQNGMNGGILSELVGEERTLISFVNIFADYMSPGVINYGGKGALVIGELTGRITPRLQRIKEELIGVEQLQISDNVVGYLWSKIGYAGVLNGSTITNKTIADVIDNPRYRVMLMNTASEIYELATLEGIRLEKFDDFDPADAWPREGRDLEKMNRQLDIHVSRLRTYTKVHTGVWRDIVVRKRKIEIGAHGSFIDDLAKKHGLDLPLYHLGHEILHQISNGEREFTTDNLELMLVKNAEVYGG